MGVSVIHVVVQEYNGMLTYLVGVSTASLAAVDSTGVQASVAPESR